MQSDFEAAKSAMTQEVAELRGLSGTRKNANDQAHGSCEMTYLMRLLSDFEGALTDIGPHLSTPRTFSDADGLSEKINAIGKPMGMEKSFRERVHRDVRELRNELMHGRRLGLRIDFDGAHRLMKEFLRACK